MSDVSEFFDTSVMDIEVAVHTQGLHLDSMSVATCRACGALVKRDQVLTHVGYHDQLRTIINKIVEALESWAEAARRRNRKPRAETGRNFEL